MGIIELGGASAQVIMFIQFNPVKYFPSYTCHFVDLKNDIFFICFAMHSFSVGKNLMLMMQVFICSHHMTIQRLHTNMHGDVIF